MTSEATNVFDIIDTVLYKSGTFYLSGEINDENVGDCKF